MRSVHGSDSGLPALPTRPLSLVSPDWIPAHTPVRVARTNSSASRIDPTARSAQNSWLSCGVRHGMHTAANWELVTRQFADTSRSHQLQSFNAKPERRLAKLASA